MIIAIAFAYIWGVVQLIVLGSLARTVRARTVFTALLVGLYACAPLTLLIQSTWTQPAMWLTDISLYSLLGIARHSLNPFVEEFVKLLPLVVLLTVPMIRRQWSITDCVLVAAATGSGFGLAEDLYRYGASSDHANAVSGGWILATNIALPTVPSLWTSITSWLPTGVGDTLNLHLAWSAIGGLAVGLIRLRGGTVSLTVGALLLFYIGADHAAFNAGYEGDWVAAALRSLPFAALRDLLGLMPIAALAAAWWLDRRRQQGLEPLLAAERAAGPRILGTLRAAVSRVPSSLVAVYGFVRMRRVYNSTRASGSDEDTDRLYAVVVEARDRLDQKLVQPKLSPWLPPLWTPSATLAVIRRPAVIVWLVLMTPPVMWFVVGGWPQTAGLQKAMTAPGAWTVMLVLSVAAQSWVAWQVVVGIRSWPRALGLPLGDETAILGLRIACGVGAVGLGGYALMRAFTGLSPSQSLYADAPSAMASGDSATALQLANGAGAMQFPPGVSYENGVTDARTSAAAVPPSPAGAARPPSPGNRALTLDEAMAADVANTRAEAADAAVREAEEAAADMAGFAAGAQAEADAADARYMEANAAWNEAVDQNIANDMRLRTLDTHNATDVEWMMQTDFSKSDATTVQRASEAATDAGLEAARADRAAEFARGLAADYAARAAAARETAQATPWKPEP
jgi:hypothetical protein